MLRLSILCVSLIALCLVDWSSGNSIDLLSARHHHAAIRRRSSDVRRLRPVQRREPFSAPDTLPAQKRGKKDNIDADGSDFYSGNIAAMTEFVKNLKAMNEEWQQEAIKSLENGKTPAQSPSISSLLTKASDSPKATKDDNKQDDDKKSSGLKVSVSNDKSNTPKKTTDDQPKKTMTKATNTPKSNQDFDDANSQPKKASTPPKKDKDDDKKKKADNDDNDDKKKQVYTPPVKVQPKLEPPKQATAPKPQPKEDDSNKNQDQNNDSSSHKSNSGGGSGGLFSGDMTFFDTGLNACGWVDTDDQYIVAASEKLWDTFGSMSNGNPICNRKVRIHHNGKTVVARVTDQCPPCDMYSLDMSPSLFAFLENPDVGRCNVQWEWA